MYLLRSRKRKLLDTVKRCQEQSDKNFQKIMLAELPVKSGLRSYGGLLSSENSFDSHLVVPSTSKNSKVTKAKYYQIIIRYLF